MEVVPWTTFTRIVQRHRGNVGVRPRPPGDLADRSGIVRVGLAAFARHAVPCDESAGDLPRIQTEQAKSAGHVVPTAARLDRHQAARGQLGMWDEA